MAKEFPILEFDPTPAAIIEPSRTIRSRDVPEHCVLSFFQEAIAQVCVDSKGKEVFGFQWEDTRHILYEVEMSGKRLAVMHPGVGAPMAAALLEEVIALGCRKFIACGGGGVLDKSIAVGHIIIPSSAVRDEGTSYHYLPPGREVPASPAGVAAIARVLQQHGVDYIISKTWTTDAIYRETPAKVQQRRSEGCLMVEMEAAAFFAVAQFRRVTFAQMLYGGDDVSGKEWDRRGWGTHQSIRENLFWLAAEAVLSL